MLEGEPPSGLQHGSPQPWKARANEGACEGGRIPKGAEVPGPSDHALVMLMGRGRIGRNGSHGRYVDNGVP